MAKGRQKSKKEIAKEAAKKAAKQSRTPSIASKASKLETKRPQKPETPPPRIEEPESPSTPKAAAAETSNIQMESKPAISRVRPILPFNPDSENNGETAWRRGEQPARVHQFPNNFDPMAFDDPGSKYSRLHGITLETRTYITRRKGQEIAIYGTLKDAEEAIALVNAWVEEYDLPKSGPTTMWAKVNSLTPQVQARLHDRVEREMKKNQWRKPPDLKVHYSYQYRILWKNIDWRLEDYLGHALEALDPIRMDCRCHIGFVRDVDRHYFVLMGNNEKKMGIAVQRIQSIEYQILARQLVPCSFYLVKPIASGNLRRSTKYEASFEPGIYGNGKRGKEAGVMMVLCGTPVGHEESMKYDDFTWSSNEVKLGTLLLGNSETTRINSVCANIWTMAFLERLKYFNGFLQMRARIGTPVFTTYRKSADKKCDLERFKEDLEDCNDLCGKFRSQFSEELRDEKLESGLFAKFQVASDSDILSAPNMSFFGTFTLPHPQNGSYQYRLEVELKPNGNDSDLVMQKWYRLEPGEDSFTNALEINFLDLEKPCTSYNLAISRCHSLLKGDQEQTLPGLYRSFANEMKLHCARAQDPSDKMQFIKYPPMEGTPNRPKIPIKNMQQKRSWRYTLKDSLYEVELSTIQNIEFAYNPFRIVPYEQRWAVQVWHPNWDEHLGENARLGIGEAAKWEAKELYFFPPRGVDRGEEGLCYEKGAGVAELMRVLSVVEEIVTSEGAEGDLTPRVKAMRVHDGFESGSEERSTLDSEMEEESDGETETVNGDDAKSVVTGVTVWEESWVPP